jgi:hypothetical protein
MVDFGWTDRLMKEVIDLPAVRLTELGRPWSQAWSCDADHAAQHFCLLAKIRVQSIAPDESAFAKFESHGSPFAARLLEDG